MERYHNVYRIESTRHPRWNYSWNGYYFVTIKTKCAIDVFGEIINGKMVLSSNGIIAENIWKKIPENFPYVKLDQFVFMPDHMHGIIIIDKNDHNYAEIRNKRKITHDSKQDIEGREKGLKTDIEGRDAINRLSTPNIIIDQGNINRVSTPNIIMDQGNINRVSTPNIIMDQENEDSIRGGVTGNFNPMLHRNLSRIIRWFKGRATFEIRKNDDLFQWQSRFIDRVIGNLNELETTREYILNNPVNYKADE